MPGIVGFASPDGVEKNQLLINGMVNRIHHGPVQNENRFAGNLGALASVYLAGSGPGLANRQKQGKSGRVWLAFYGMVFLDDHDCSDDTCFMAEHLLNSYLNGGLAAVCGLNGTYNLAIFEDDTGKLTLVRDQTGYSKLFYWHSGSQLMFASEYKAISWLPSFQKTIDPVCVSDIFLYRTPLEGRTLFQDIRSLPPAAILTFHNGQLSIDTYWKPTYSSPGIIERSDEEYADELYERIKRAVQRRARAGVCILLTGGLDSRIIAGTYQQVAPQTHLTAATAGSHSGSDVFVGKALAQAFDIPHHHVPVDSSYLHQYAPSNVWKTEGKNGAYASWISSMVPFLEEHGFRYAMSGLSGNFISGRHFPKELLAARTLAEGIRAVEGNLNPYLNGLKKIMRSDVFLDAACESAATLSLMYRRAETDNLIQRGDEFNFYFRLCRHSNTEDSLSDVCLALEPFLDTEVFDYAIGAIPPSVRARGIFNTLLVLRHLPQAAKINNGNTGRPLQWEVTVGQSPVLSAFDKYRRKIARRLNKNYANHNTIPHINAIRTESRSFVLQLFDLVEFYDDLFDPVSVRSYLDDFLNERHDNFMIIDAMVTFILWRLQFCHLCHPLNPEIPLTMERNFESVPIYDLSTG